MDSVSPASPNPTNLASTGHGEASATARRRRDAGAVVVTACQECRKKRTRCDGGQPACSRCLSQGIRHCVYIQPTKTSKDQLRNEIQVLQDYQKWNDRVWDVLASSAPADEMSRKTVLEKIRSGQDVEQISQWLERTYLSTSATSSRRIAANERHHKRGETSSTDARSSMASRNANTESRDQWSAGTSTRPLSNSDVNDLRNSARTASWVQEQEDDNFYVVSMDEDWTTGAPSWTNVTKNNDLINHLMRLFFCWEYPSFTVVCRDHFFQDFRSGNTQLCSSALVNAILAVACRFSDHPDTLGDPDNPLSSGDHFFAEAQRLFDETPDQHTLPTAQALGVMSIREASCGRDSESWYYAGQAMRLALAMNLHERRDQDIGNSHIIEVRTVAFWGIYCLDHAWALATGTLPHTPQFPRLPISLGLNRNIEASPWSPYTDEASTSGAAAQPSNVQTIIRHFTELCMLMHEAQYLMHTPTKPLHSRNLVQLYRKYLQWYDNVPNNLRLGENYTPAGLFKQMYYQCAVLLLFRPLIKLRVTNSNIVPRDICVDAADAILGFLHTYHDLYTLKRTPSFVPYVALTATIMHLFIFATATPDTESSSLPSTPGQTTMSAPSNVSRRTTEDPIQMEIKRQKSIRTRDKAAASIKQGLGHLEEMVPYHQFASRALLILRFLAHKWQVHIELGGSFSSGSEATAKAKPSMPATGSQNASTSSAASLGSGSSGSSGSSSQSPHKRRRRGAPWPGPSFGEDGSGTRFDTGSLNYFAPNFSMRDFDSSLGSLRLSSVSVTSSGPLVDGVSNPSSENADRSRSPRSSTSLTPPEELAHPLFWPFPMAGRPNLPSGAALADAGFALL